MFYNAIHSTMTGAAHVRAMKPCQDWSFAESTQNYAMAIVADGHGGLRYVRSGFGAAKATGALECTFAKFVMPFGLPLVPGKAEDCLRHILLAEFEQSVLFGSSLLPLSEDEARLADPEKPFQWYGTTLCGVLTHSDPDFTVCVACGDGEIVLLKDGETLHPLPVPETESLSITPGSMCHLDPSEIRVCILPYRVEAALVVTDGVVNSLTHESALDEISKKLFGEMEKNPEFAKELPALLKLITENGSGDDVSLAAFAQTEHAPPPPVTPQPRPRRLPRKRKKKSRLRWFRRWL